MSDRPLIFLDIESAVPAGSRPDPARDRVVHLALVEVGGDIEGGLMQRTKVYKCYPGFAMSTENVAIHGITNEEAATYPTFKSQAAAIHTALAGCNLAGYNSNNYDIPLLWEEFARAGIHWSLDGIHKIDVANIFKKKEERTLTAAVKFYTGADHSGAHGAEADALATAEVLVAQTKRYEDLANLSLEELAKFSSYDNRVDLAGKLILNEQGQVCYGFGKSQGVPVVEDKGYGHWMLKQDFSMNTKMTLQKYLYG